MKKLRERKRFGSLKLLVAVFFCCLGANTLAQDTIVTGNVKDESGDALIGVIVQIKGLKTGTYTDADGKFTIKVPSENASLEFSFLGYSKKEIKVKGQKKIQVVLLEDIQSLEEVVVIGYGEIKRQDVTGSVGMVKTIELQKAPVRSFEEALGGRIAGVSVTSAEGAPGEGMNIVIRGQNSITQENSPLYVIDGFPMEDFDSNTLNPADVESLDVLKDASATAIYGSRGANGVIMITTRKGKEGPPQMSFDFYYGSQKINKKMELMEPDEFVQLQLEIDPLRANIAYLQDGTITPEAYKGKSVIDWQDKVMQTAPIQSYTYSLMGGSKATKYSVSLNYFNQEGIIIKSGFDRYQGRLRLDQDINKRIKMGINMNYSQTKQYGTAVRFSGNTEPSLGLMYNVLGYRPVNGSGDLNELLDTFEDEEIVAAGGSGLRYNPLMYIQNETKDVFIKTNFFNIFMEYQLTKSLKLRVTGGSNLTESRSETFYNSLHPASRVVGGSSKGVNGSEMFDSRQSLLNENTLTYNKTFNKKHALNAMAAFTLQKYDRNRFGGVAWRVPQESLGVSGLDEGEAQPLTSEKTGNTLMSYLTRVNYNYMAKYYVTCSFRADGSSKFTAENRWGYYPSGSVSWRMSQEEFLKGNKFISDAKIRASYGTTGNNRVSDFGYFPALDNNNTYGYSQNNEFTQGAATSNLGNNKLKWETTKTSDVGIDVGLLEQRITITADWYKKVTENLLLNANLPPSAGFRRAMMNVGSVQNMGFELSFGTINIDNQDFTWTSNFNISWNRSKVLSLADGETEMLSTMSWNANYTSVPLYTATVGKPIAQIIGLVWDGNYQINDFTWQNNSDPAIPHEERDYVFRDDVQDNGMARNQIKPGFIKYLDIPDENGNTDGHIDNNDRIVIGDPNPDYIGGLTNNFTYKRFDLNFFFQFSVGGDIVNANRIAFEGTYRYGLNQYASYNNRWTPENPDAPNHIPRGGGNSYYSTRIIEDGSFLRLKTLQFAYNFPGKWTKKISVSKLRLYFSAQNLITWTGYSGWDPEVSVNNSALTPGFDYSPYPRSRTYVFGLNATF